MAREIAEEETGKPATLAVQMFPKIHVMVPLAAVVSPVNNFGFEKMVRLAREGVVEEINVPSFFWGGGLVDMHVYNRNAAVSHLVPFRRGGGSKLAKLIQIHLRNRVKVKS